MTGFTLPVKRTFVSAKRSDGGTKLTFLDQLRKIVCVLTDEVDPDNSANAARFNVSRSIRGKRPT